MAVGSIKDMRNTHTLQILDSSSFANFVASDCNISSNSRRALQ